MEEEIIKLKEEIKLQHTLRLKSEKEWEKSNNFYKDLYFKELEKSSNKYVKELEHTIRLRDERISTMVDKLWFTECMRLHKELNKFNEHVEPDYVEPTDVEISKNNLKAYNTYKIEYVGYRMLYSLLVKNERGDSVLREDDKVYLYNERLKGYK